MRKVITIIILVSFFSVATPARLFSQRTDSSYITLHKLKSYLLKSSKTTDRLLPLLLKEGIFSRLEYDSIALDNKELKLLLKREGKEDSSYLQPLYYCYATVEEFIFNISNRKKAQSKKTALFIQQHLNAIRKAERAILGFNGGVESTKELNMRFGLWISKARDPM